MKEAAARIKINKLLEEAGWRFFADAAGTANIQLEPSVTLTKQALDGLGENFEQAGKGFIDFLLLDSKGFPLIVLEAKAEDKNPLIGKEQARKYAKSQNCRFVILSNGNLHYFWDLERGNPYHITSFPSPESVAGYKQTMLNPQRLVEDQVSDDYIVLTQRPNYQTEAAWRNQAERPGYIQTNKLRFLRPYQLKAVHALQRAVKDGADRFLFEMATGTGKTLTAAAVIKLFLRSGNARRVLFLVDRLELEDQAKKAFAALLSADFKTVIYKENRDDWRHAEIVVTTVQSLLFNNKYQQLFSPTDFDLVISDEAHRSIGGNARAVFDYFIGYKLGLTATPRDYLKRFIKTAPTSRDPRETERRLLLDTYRTFGCENSQPTFRYTLLDGVKDGFLINPTVVDARTEITTELLSEEGFVVSFTDDAGEDQQEAFKQREFEKRFFADATNQLFCKTFLEHALRDPVSGEIGKSIVFAVSQNHAAKLAQILNQMADRMFPGKYQSDFAVQVTSQIPDAQQMTINFANNKLLGNSNVIPAYKTSKARVCVTVGMMTTGYDCPDILNLGLFRPIFSPTDFIQIKGRGTRKHDFREELFDETIKEHVEKPLKSAFKLFDFFANCEYFEKEFNYDEVLKLPRPKGKGGEGPNPPPPPGGLYDHTGEDLLETIKEETIGYGLGAQRRAVAGSDLPDAAAFLKAHFHSPKPDPSAPPHQSALLVPKSKIAANGDYNLSGERYREGAASNHSFPLVALGETSLFRVESGGTPKSDVEEYWGGGIPWATLVDLPATDFISEITATKRTISEEGLRKSAAKMIPANSVVVSTRATIGRIAINRVPIATNQGFKNVVIEDPARALPEYVALALTKLVPTMQAWATGGTFAEISKSKFCELQIPLPPLEIQKEIVAEIEGYQKVINGARAVLDHYRPHIPIHPDWPMVELGEVCDVRDGTHDSPKYVLEGYPLITSKNLKDGFIDFSDVNLITREDLDAINKRSKVDAGDLLMPMIGTIGNPVVADASREYAVKNVALIKFPKGCQMNNRFLKDVLDSAAMQDRFQRQASGSTQKFIPLGFIRKLEIPLPSLAEQQAIVAEIEAEQALVAANRELITRFEQKIQTTLARIWGETPAVPT